MIGGEAFCNAFGIVGLIKRIDIETDGAGVDRPLAGLGLQSNHHTAVYATRQESPQRHVRHHAGTNRRLHQRDQFLLQLVRLRPRSEEQTSELKSLMRISYAVFFLNKQTNDTTS